MGFHNLVSGLRFSLFVSNDRGFSDFSVQCILLKEISFNIKQWKQTIKLNPTFRRGYDCIIKEKLYQTMQITAFKVCFARRINLKGCEVYENTFKRISVNSFQWDLCHVGYIGYTRGHLHDGVKGHKHQASAICQTLQDHAREDASEPAKAFRRA